MFDAVPEAVHLAFAIRKQIDSVLSRIHLEFDPQLDEREPILDEVVSGLKAVESTFYFQQRLGVGTPALELMVVECSDEHSP